MLTEGTETFLQLVQSTFNHKLQQSTAQKDILYIDQRFD